MCPAEAYRGQRSGGHGAAGARNEGLSPATTWRELEDRMLRETGLSRKNEQCMIPRLGEVQNREIHGDRK